MTRRFDMADRDARQQGKIRNDESQMNVLGSFKCGYFTSFTGAVKTRGTVTVGSFCAIGDDCRLIATGHNIQLPNLQVRLQIELGSPKKGNTKGPIAIGENVWIGDGVKVLSGVRVGNGAILAAGCVVTSDVPDFAVFAGIPAKFVKWRFTESVRKQLADIAWWHWPMEEIHRNASFFDLEIPEDGDMDLVGFLASVPDEYT